MKKDIVVNLVITIGISLTLFLLNKYFSFYLGAENLGLMKLFTQMLAYLNLAEIGLSSASAYALYKPLVEKDEKQISVILSTISSLYTKIFLFILVIGLILNPIIPFFIKNKTINNRVYLYWSLYVISTALNYTFAKYSILFTADQKYRFVRLVEGGSRIFCQAIQIIIIIKYHSFLGFIIMLVLNNFIQYIFYKFHYKKYYKYIIKTKEKEGSITKDLKNLFWHKLAGLIVFNTDLIIISKFISLEIVGIYASYLMVTQMIITILNIILNVLKPKIGKYIAENNKENIFEYFRKLNVLFLSVSIILTFNTYRLVDSFMILWLGENFILSKVTTILILINLFIWSFRGIIDLFKEASGFFDDIYLPISEAIINFVISIILVQYIELNGVILGTICSNILVICIAKPILVFERCFDKSLSEYIKIYSNYLFLVITSLLVLNFMNNLISFDISITWLTWVAKACIISINSLIIVFLLFLSNKDFRNCLRLIRKNV